MREHNVKSFIWSPGLDPQPDLILKSFLFEKDRDLREFVISCVWQGHLGFPSIKSCHKLLNFSEL